MGRALHCRLESFPLDLRNASLVWSDRAREKELERQNTFLQHFPMDRGVRNDVLEPLELADDKCAVCLAGISVNISSYVLKRNLPHPMDKHTRHRGDICPFLEETLHLAFWIYGYETVIVHV